MIINDSKIHMNVYCKRNHDYYNLRMQKRKRKERGKR